MDIGDGAHGNGTDGAEPHESVGGESHDTPDSEAQGYDSQEQTPQDGVPGELASESSAPDTPLDPAGPALGSAIGSQFEPPLSDHLAAQPGSPAAGSPPPPAPTPPVVTPPSPPVVTPPSSATPWGTPTPTPSIGATAPATGPDFGSAPPTAPASSFSNSYSTPAGPVEYPVVGGVDDGSGSSKLPWIAAVIAAVVLLGGGSFLAASAFGASGGEESPEAAIEALLAAVGEEDFVTVAELLEPSERRTVAEPVIAEVLPELKRLGVLADSTDAGNVEGLDLEFTDVEYRVDRLVGVDDIAHVFLTGGEVSTIIDGAALPLDDALEVDPDDLNEQTTITEDANSPAVFVERDGRWYFSMWFTIAEAARLDVDERLPSPDESPERLPSDNPEDAVAGMFTAMTEFDLTAVIGHMDPEEMAALYRYSPLFLEEAEQELQQAEDDLRNEGFTWEMTNFDFDVDENGDDAVVTLRGFTFDVQGDGFVISFQYGRDEISGEFDVEGVSGRITATTTQIDLNGSEGETTFEAELSLDPVAREVTGSASTPDESGSFSFALDPSGECSRYELIISSEESPESGCLEEELGIEDAAEAIEVFDEIFNDWPTEFPGFDFRARKTDGGWFVSPLGTLSDAVVEGLESIEDDEFSTLFDPFEELTNDAVGDPFEVFDDLADGIDDDAAVSEEDFGNPSSDPVGEEINQINVANGELDTFEGSLERGGFDTFTLELEAGDAIIVTAQANGSSLDTVLSAIDPNGGEVVRNDDAPSSADLPLGTDSQIVFAADQSGIHSFVVEAYQGSSAGEYMLTVDRASDGIVDAEGETPRAGRGLDADDTEDVVTLDIGPEQTDEVRGSLDDEGAFDAFLIDLEDGESVVITLEADATSSLDPLLTISNPAGAAFASNDDALSGADVLDSRDSQVGFLVTESGTYMIAASAFAESSEGDYTLTVERRAGTGIEQASPDSVVAGDILDLAPGNNVELSGRVQGDQGRADYSIELAEGDELIVTVESADPAELDPRVTLVLDGLEVAQNDDADDSESVSDRRDSKLIVTITATGSYVISIDGFAATEGAFTMTVEKN